MGATINTWSDRKACTIIQVLHNARRLVLQEDTATRTDLHGMSESQYYQYQANHNGTIHIGTLRRDGRYRIRGTQRPITLDVRNEYYDFSF